MLFLDEADKNFDLLNGSFYFFTSSLNRDPKESASFGELFLLNNYKFLSFDKVSYSCNSISFIWDEASYKLG